MSYVNSINPIPGTLTGGTVSGIYIYATRVIPASSGIVLDGLEHWPGEDQVGAYRAGVYAGSLTTISSLLSSNLTDPLTLSISSGNWSPTILIQSVTLVQSQVYWLAVFPRFIHRNTPQTAALSADTSRLVRLGPIFQTRPQPT